MFFPDCSTVIWHAPRHVVSAPRLSVGASRLVAGAPWCSQAYCWLTQAWCRRTQAHPGAPGGQCIGPVNSGIWPPWNSHPTTLRHSQRLPVTKTHFADVCRASRWLSSSSSENICWSCELSSGRKVECPMSAPLGISHIGHEPYETWATMTCSGKSLTLAANRG